jgi:hypothetical protein
MRPTRPSRRSRNHGFGRLGHRVRSSRRAAPGGARSPEDLIDRRFVGGPDTAEPAAMANSTDVPRETPAGTDDDSHVLPHHLIVANDREDASLRVRGLFGRNETPVLLLRCNDNS